MINFLKAGESFSNCRKSERLFPSEIDVLAILFVAGVIAVGFAIAPLNHWDAAGVLAGKFCLVAPGEGHQR